MENGEKLPASPENRIDCDDPLKNPALKPPGILEKLREAFLGECRPLDCVQVEVTSFCQGRCVYCPHTTQSRNWKSRHMKAETFAALWPLLRRGRRAHLQGWGEPLLHPRFFDFAAAALRAGCQVSTTSCGLFMDERTADQIINSGMDMIAFSLVGVDRKSNDARQNVDFGKVCANIKYLRRRILESGAENPPQLHLAYLMLADRAHVVERLPDLMNELDVQAAVVSTLDYLAAPEQKALAFFPGEDDKIAAARTVLEKAAERAAASGRSIYYALPGKGVQAQPGGCRENTARSLYVDAGGQISPCVYLNVPGGDAQSPRLVFGNAEDSDAWEIWQLEEFRTFRHSLQRGNTPAQCAHCPKRNEFAV